MRLLTSSAGTAGDGAADYVAYGTENKAAQAFLQIANPFAVSTVRRAVREFHPEVVWINMFAHHLSPAALLALARIPKVLMVSDYKLICPIGSKLLPDGSLCHDPAGRICTRNGCLSLPHWFRDQPRYALIRSVVKKTDRILACSRSVQRELAQAGLKSEVLYLSAPARPRGFVRRPSTEPTILFCGRLEVEKGVHLLIRTFSRLHREFTTTRLVVAGRGAERSKLENLAGSLGVAESVDFLGWMSPRQLERPWSHAWASVVPSVWAEPQGLVAVEAIIRGVPVIASSAGGLGEIVEHGVSGLLFPNNDEEALLNCLRMIASGSAFPEHTLAGEVVRKAEVKFSMGSHIESMRRVFAKAIQEAAS